MIDAAEISQIATRVLSEKNLLPEREAATLVQDMLTRMAKLRERSSTLLPGQTLGIAPKEALLTSALFFDRVWFPAPVKSPLLRQFGFFGGTDQEALICVLHDLEEDGKITDGQHRDILVGCEQFKKHISDLTFASTISNVLAAERGIVGVPVYSNHMARDREFRAGENAAIVALVQNLQVVDEDRLEIEQILEFRQDKESVSNLRRFRHWLDTEMAEKPLSYVQDEVSIRLERYETALRKHGIDTVIGVFSDLLDEKFILGVSGAVASAGATAGAFWAGIAGLGLAVGRATLSVSKRLVDLRDRASIQGAEVAVVSEIAALCP